MCRLQHSSNVALLHGLCTEHMVHCSSGNALFYSMAVIQFLLSSIAVVQNAWDDRYAGHTAECSSDRP